jgi:signal transduction histidine kinase
MSLSAEKSGNRSARRSVVFWICVLVGAASVFIQFGLQEHIHTLTALRERWGFLPWQINASVEKCTVLAFQLNTLAADSSSVADSRAQLHAATLQLRNQTTVLARLGTADALQFQARTAFLDKLTDLKNKLALLADALDRWEEIAHTNLSAHQKYPYLERITALKAQSNTLLAELRVLSTPGSIQGYYILQQVLPIVTLLSFIALGFGVWWPLVLKQEEMLELNRTLDRRNEALRLDLKTETELGIQRAERLEDVQALLTQREQALDTLRHRVQALTVQLETEQQKTQKLARQVEHVYDWVMLGKTVPGYLAQQRRLLERILALADEHHATGKDLLNALNVGQADRAYLLQFARANQQRSLYLADVIRYTYRFHQTYLQLALEAELNDPALELQTVSLASIVHEVLYLLQPLFDEKHIQVENSIQPDVTVRSLPGFLTQVVLIILENVAFHAFQEPPASSNSTPTLWIASAMAADAPSVVVLSCVDNGSGIRVQPIEHVFDPFYSGSTDLSFTGMGLTVAKRWCESYLKAELTLASQPNTGTRVELRLPAAVPSTQ